MPELDVRQLLTYNGERIQFNQLPQKLRALKVRGLLRQYTDGIQQTVDKQFWPWKIRGIIRMWKSRRMRYASGAGAGEVDINGKSTYWAPLSPKYTKWKRRIAKRGGVGGATGFWIHTGEVTNELKSKVGQATWRQTHDGWTSRVGTDIPHAQYVQEGTGRMPARPLYFFTKEDAKEVQRLVREVVNTISSQHKKKKRR